jgi:hypothetical protein
MVICPHNLFIIAATFIGVKYIIRKEMHGENMDSKIPRRTGWESVF